MDRNQRNLRKFKRISKILLFIIFHHVDQKNEEIQKTNILHFDNIDNLLYSQKRNLAKRIIQLISF